MLADLRSLASSPTFCPLRLLPPVLRRHKTNRPLERIGRRHEFAQRIEDFSELVAGIAAEGVVAHGQRRGGLLQLSQPLGQKKETQTLTLCFGVSS